MSRNMKTEDIAQVAKKELDKAFNQLVKDLKARKERLIDNEEAYISFLKFKLAGTRYFKITHDLNYVTAYIDRLMSL